MSAHWKSAVTSAALLITAQDLGDLSFYWEWDLNSSSFACLIFYSTKYIIKYIRIFSSAWPKSKWFCMNTTYLPPPPPKWQFWKILGGGGGGGGGHFDILVISWQFEHFWANNWQGINNSHTTIKLWINEDKLFHLIFTIYQNYPLAFKSGFSLWNLESTKSKLYLCRSLYCNYVKTLK